MVLGRDPRKSESHLHWLEGWGKRLQKHLETGTPSSASSYSYQPDPEASKALAVYSTNFPYLITTIERFRDNCDKHCDSYTELPNEENAHAFATAMEQLAKRISDAVDAIAAQKETYLGPQKYGDVENPLDYDESQVKARSKSGAVILFRQFECPIVNNEEVPSLNPAQYNVVMALLQAPNHKLSQADLETKSGHTEAHKILKRLAKKERWSEVIRIAGKGGMGYQIH